MSSPTDRSTIAARPDRLVSLTSASPVGELTVVAGGDGVVAVLWPHETPTRVRLPDGVRRAGRGEHPVADAAVEQLEDYFNGTRCTFDLPLAPSGTPFQQAAWSVLREIPYGTTITYGEQAARLGDVSKARAVGAANGRNPLSIVVPCHRVVAAGGQLGGFAGGLMAKQWLLEHERRVLRV